MPLIIVLWVALLSTVMNTHAQGVECPSPQAQGNSPLCAALGKLNGHWYSEKWKYGYELTNGVGIATSSNSSKFKAGDKIIRLTPVSTNTFSGEQVYTDGKFYKIDVKLEADGSLVFAGEKNISWVMTRTATTNLASTKPPSQNTNQPVAPPVQSSETNSTNIAVNLTPQTTSVSSPPTARQPTDAQSYCDKVASSAVADRISKKYVVVRGKLSELFELSGKNSSDPALARFISQTRRAFTLGFDDESRSKTKVLVKRLNDTIPKKDAYNQDIAVLNYIPWFAACASTFKDSALRFIFLDPSDNKALAAFYGSAPSARNTKLQELWEAPNLGGLYDRRIQEKVGLASMGINPLWVTPMLFLSADGTLIAEATEAEKRLDSLISQLTTHTATLKADMQAFSSPNNQSPPIAPGQPAAVTSSSAPVSNFNEYCQRLTTNSDVKKFLAGLVAEGKGSIFLDHTYLDNKNGDLQKWVVQNMSRDLARQRSDGPYEKIEWVNKCIIRERNTDLFLLSFVLDYRRNEPQWYEKQLVNADKAAEVLSRPSARARDYDFKVIDDKNYEQRVKNGKLGGSVSPGFREATLLAFLFPGAEEMVKKTSLEAITPKQAHDGIKAEVTVRAQQKLAEDTAQQEAAFVPTRNLVAFSKSKVMSSAFQTCIKNETKYFENIILKEKERKANTAAFVWQQQEMKTELLRWQKNTATGVIAYCLNRLNFSMNVVFMGIEMARPLSTALPKVDLSAKPANLESLFTSAAIDTFQKNLQSSPEIFRKDRGVGSDDAFYSGLALQYLEQLLDERGKFGLGTWK